jgi:predicted transcriptional regulator
MTGRPAGSTEPKVCTCPRAKHEHGTKGMYGKHNCRCFRCRLATSRLRADHRNGGGLSEHLVISRAGTARRVQALHRIGYTAAEIGEFMGVTKQAVLYYRVYPGPILRDTAQRVSVAYEVLAYRPPRSPSAPTMRWAVRQGWATPFAWDDDTIDDPAAKPHGVRLTAPDRTVDDVAVAEALAGRPVALTRHERAAAVRLATARRLSAERIAELLGTTQRTVQRDQARAKVAA